MSEDRIVTGAATVMVNGQCVARLGDATVHGATISQGSSNVVVGGPTTGSLVGAAGPGESLCKALAAGRASRSHFQSFANCGLESARLLIARRRQGTGEPIPLESELFMTFQSENPHRWTIDLDDWHASGESDGDIGKWAAKQGGTLCEDEKLTLERYGVEAEVVSGKPSLEWVAQQVSQGKGLITGHDAGVLWDKPSYSGSGHSVAVTGVEYDEFGNISHVIVVDSGAGRCSSRVPAAVFRDSLLEGVVVTKGSLWRA
jgi:hypothetical protein